MPRPDACRRRLQSPQKDIAEGILVPGQKLITRELSERYRIGEPPIKQALNRLITEGLIESTPRRGVKVRAIAWDGIEELWGIRLRSETYYARQIIGNFDADAAELFAREGAKVAVNSVSASGADTLALVKQAGGDGLFVQGDVAKAADAKRMIDETVRAFGKLDIRVKVVCPGTTDTPSTEARMRSAPDYEAAKAAFIARQPMGRLGRPEKIAEAILFACCDEAAFFNGGVLTIDGGATI